MPKALNVILLLMYCHFALAGFPGAYLMKKAAQSESYSWADTLPSDAEDGGDEDTGQDAASKSSPCDPDQCHRSSLEQPVPFRLTAGCRPDPLFRPDALPRRIFDIQTPPPEL